MTTTATVCVTSSKCLDVPMSALATTAKAPLTTMARAATIVKDVPSKERATLTRMPPSTMAHVIEKVVSRIVQIIMIIIKTLMLLIL